MTSPCISLKRGGKFFSLPGDWCKENWSMLQIIYNKVVSWLTILLKSQTKFSFSFLFACLQFLFALTLRIWKSHSLSSDFYLRTASLRILMFNSEDVNETDLKLFPKMTRSNSKYFLARVWFDALERSSTCGF